MITCLSLMTYVHDSMMMFIYTLQGEKQTDSAEEEDPQLYKVGYTLCYLCSLFLLLKILRGCAGYQMIDNQHGSDMLKLVNLTMVTYFTIPPHISSAHRFNFTPLPSHIFSLVLSHPIQSHNTLHLMSPHLMSAHLISTQLISPIPSHPTPSHLIPSHLLSSRLISSQLILSQLNSSHVIPSHPFPSHHISPHLISTHLIRSHLISTHLITSHHISSHHISSQLISLHLISSHLITSHLISSHLISSHLNSTQLISSHLISIYLISSETFSCWWPMCRQASQTHDSRNRSNKWFM